MSENLLQNRDSIAPAGTNKYRVLSEDQPVMIDEALQSLGGYGEVRLVVFKGRLRYIVTEKSHDVMKWQPGKLER